MVILFRGVLGSAVNIPEGHPWGNLFQGDDVITALRHAASQATANICSHVSRARHAYNAKDRRHIKGEILRAV
jgi:hypothetical protein